MDDRPNRIAILARLKENRFDSKAGVGSGAVSALVSDIKSLEQAINETARWSSACRLNCEAEPFVDQNDRSRRNLIIDLPLL
jgi:hypothetical protein